MAEETAKNSGKNGPTRYANGNDAKQEQSSYTKKQTKTCHKAKYPQDPPKISLHSPIRRQHPTLISPTPLGSRKMSDPPSTLQGVALLLLCSVAYDTFISRRGTVETWWWGVYVAAAPLLLGDSIHPLLGLFFTRFVIEALTMARGHWAVAVSSGDAVDATVRGLPVLPD